MDMAMLDSMLYVPCEGGRMLHLLYRFAGDIVVVRYMLLLIILLLYTWVD